MLRIRIVVPYEFLRRLAFGSGRQTLKQDDGRFAVGGATLSFQQVVAVTFFDIEHGNVEVDALPVGAAYLASKAPSVAIADRLDEKVTPVAKVYRY